MADRRSVHGHSTDKEMEKGQKVRGELASYMRDPYTLTTRRMKRNVLVMAAVSILIVHVGMVPERVPAIGVDSKVINEASLLVVLALSALYMTCTFALSAVAENAAFYVAAHTGDRDALEPTVSDMLAIPDRKPAKEANSFNFGLRASEIRLMFEFWSPVVIGLYASGALAWKAFC